MTRAIDVVKYIKARQHVWGEMQLHKLVYLAQAWSLAWDGRPLFPERIEAWEKGPVVRALRYRTDAADGTVLAPDERAVVDAVLAQYGHLNGTELSAVTHKQAPWADVWANRGDRDWCDDEISHDSMRKFFTAEALAGHGPTRTSTRPPAAGVDEEIHAIAAANAERWADALTLLSR